MIINNIKLSILGAVAIFIACNIALAARIELKNNTYAWNIKYRTTIAEAPEDPKIERLLAPGQTVTLDVSSVSIRRSGVGSSIVSSWTNVPLRDLLNQTELTRRMGYTTILISTSLTGGWSFNVSR